MQYTLIDARSAWPVDVLEDGQPRVSVEAFEAATGWQVKPEGFCRGDVCIPAQEAVADATVDLQAYARLSGRPLIIDAEQHAMSLGTAAAARGDELHSLEAPDFTLPDLEGKLHSLSDYRGTKVLLAAYASW